MAEPTKRTHPKLKDDDPERRGYLLNQKANNYVRKLQLQHALEQRQQGQKVEPLKNVLLVPGAKHPDLTWPVYLGEKGEPIAIYTLGKLGEGTFGGVFVGVNLDTGEPRAVKIQYPKNNHVNENIKSEESVLVTLSRFDDRFETQNMDMAKEYIENEFFRKLYGLEKAFAKLGVMKENEFKNLVREGNTETLVNKLITSIQKKYPENFQQFKADFLKNDGSEFLEMFLGVDKDHFENNSSLENFKALLLEADNFLIESLPLFVESLQEELDGLNNFMEIGAQELVWGQNLNDIADHEAVSDFEKLDIAIKMLEKIHALHQARDKNAPQGLVHRDIKGGNVMYDKDTKTVTIVDMGYTKPMDATHAFSDDSLVGTPGALAPELLIAKSNDKDIIYGPPTDMYAAGFALLELYSKLQVQIPFYRSEEYGEGAVEQAMAIKKNLESNPDHTGLPPVLATAVTDVLSDDVDEPLKSIYNQIKKMIDVNPTHRATFPDSIEALKKIQHSLDKTQEISTPAEAAPTSTKSAPKTAPQELQQHKNIKKVLDVAISQLADVIKTLQADQPPRSGTRKQIIKSLQQPHQKLITDVSYWMATLQSIRRQNDISPQQVQEIIAKLKSRDQDPQQLSHSSTVPQIHSRLQSILTATQDSLSEYSKPPTQPSTKKPYRS